MKKLKKTIKKILFSTALLFGAFFIGTAALQPVEAATVPTAWKRIDYSSSGGYEMWTEWRVTAYDSSGNATVQVRAGARCPSNYYNYWGADTQMRDATTGQDLGIWRFPRDTWYGGTHYSTYTFPVKLAPGSHHIVGKEIPFRPNVIEAKVDFWINVPQPTYYLDVNGQLDGTNANNTAGYGTFDVYKNGSLVANDVTDFYQDYLRTNTYEIKDIKPYTGKHYSGVASGSTSGTIWGTTSVRLKFDTNTYKVRYNGNGATGGSMSDQSFTYGTGKNLSSNKFTRTYYTFKGWNTRADGKGTAYSNGQWVNNLTATHGGVVTLYAQWTRNQYYVDVNQYVDGTQVSSNYPATFDLTINNSKVANDNSDYYAQNYAGYTYSLSDVKVKDGYKLVNITNQTGTINGYKEIRINLQKEDYIIYDLQGGHINKDIDNPNDYVIVGNGYYAIQNQKDKSKYVHNDSLKTSDGAGAVLYSGGGDAYQTLWYFQRYKDTPYYYIISKHSGKALNLSGDPPASLSTAHVEQWTQLDGGKMADFLWYMKENSDGSVTIYNKHTNYCLSLDYASTANGTALVQIANKGDISQKWKLVGRVGDTSEYAKQRKVATSSFMVNSSVPLKDDYVFVEWNTKADGTGTAYQPGQTINPSDDMTLYAIWVSAYYDVNFNGNGADSGTMESIVEKHDRKFTLPENEYSRKNYDFKGWNTKPDGTGTSYKDQQEVVNIAPPGGSVTLYAQWEAQKYTVVFKGNGNDGGSMPDQKISWDSSTKLNKNEYTRENSDFVGWNTEPDGSGTWFDDEETVKNLTDGNETFVLYAQWDDKPVLKTRPGAYLVNTDLPIDKIIDENADATDREDEDIAEHIIVTQIRYNDSGNVVKNPTSIDSTHARTVEVTYQVTDSYGHTVTKTDTITIISLEYEGDPGDDGNDPMIYSRFIADGYQDTLESNSKWNHQDDYKNALTSALQKAREKWNAWLNH